ncbi:MAG: rRNA maturation RNase YbeY [Thermoleophilia bacterium]|nr:rRNA maturation RNase YbeY [Thermoleophilia bacterium]
MSATVEVVDQVGLGCIRDPVTALALAVLDAEQRVGGVVVAFVDEVAMADLNGRYRGLEEPTDVLSFSEADAEDWSDAGLPCEEAIPDLGEVVVCPAVVSRYAAEEGADARRQMAWTIIHGLLHLLGYDHETDHGEMRLREQTLLEELTVLARALPAPEGDADGS